MDEAWQRCARLPSFRTVSVSGPADLDRYHSESTIERRGGDGQTVRFSPATGSPRNRLGDSPANSASCRHWPPIGRKAGQRASDCFTLNAARRDGGIQNVLGHIREQHAVLVAPVDARLASRLGSDIRMANAGSTKQCGRRRTRATGRAAQSGGGFDGRLPGIERDDHRGEIQSARSARRGGGRAGRRKTSCFARWRAPANAMRLRGSRTWNAGEICRVAFALAAYRVDHGRYPSELSELVPRYIDAVPKDRFSGLDLHFHLEQEGYVLSGSDYNGNDTPLNDPRSIHLGNISEFACRRERANRRHVRAHGVFWPHPRDASG